MSADFPITIEIDPANAIRGAEAAGAALSKLPDKKVIAVEADTGAFSSAVRDLQAQTAALAATAGGRRDLSAIIQAENQLRSRGVELTDQQRAALAALLGEQEKQQQAVSSLQQQEAAQIRANEAYAAAVSGLQQELSALEAVASGRGRDVEVMELENRLRQQGVQLSAGERAGLTQLVEAKNRQRAAAEQVQQVERSEVQVLERLRGPLRQYQNDLQALIALLHRGEISQAEFNAEANRSKSAFQNAGKGGGGDGGGIGGIGSSLLQGAQAALPVASVAGAVIGAEQGIESIVRLGSEYANLQNKLRQVTGSESELISTQKQLFEISNATGTAVSDVVSIYQRTKNAVSELGISSSQTRGFVENLSKIIATSGANSTEAGQALIQLSQGLGRGTLQGQDLKAVLEDVPAIGKSIAAGLGVPFAKLKELGEQGKLTTKQIFDAIQSQGGAIDAAFGKRIPTVDQAMTKLHNTFLQFAGEVTKGLGPALNEIVDVISQIGPQIGPVIAQVIQFGAHAAAPGILGLAHFISSSVEAFVHMKDAMESVNPAFGKFVELASNSNIGTWGTLLDRTVNATHSLNDAVRDGVVIFRARQNNAEKAAKAEVEAQQHVVAMEKVRITIAETLIDTIKSGGEVSQQTLDNFVVGEGAATEATKAHQQALDKLAETLDSGGKAQRDFNIYVSELLELQKEGRITGADVTKATREYATANDAALDPVGNLSQKVAEHIAALQGNAQATLQQTLFQKYLNVALKAGTEDTDDLRSTIEALSTAEADAIKAHEKAAKAATAGASAYKALIDELFPTIQAEKDLATAEKFLESWVRKGKLSVDEGAEALERYRRKHEELLDPVRGFIRTIDDEIASTYALTQAQKDQLDIDKFVDEQRQKGIHVYQIEIDNIRKKQAALEAARRAQDFSKGPGGDVTGDIGAEVFAAHSALRERFAAREQESLTALAKAKLDLTAVTRDYNAAVAEGVTSQDVLSKSFLRMAAAVAQAKKAVADAAKAEAEAAKAAHDALLQAQAAAGDFGAATELALQHLKERILNVGPLVDQAFTDAFDGAEDIIGGFVSNTGDALWQWAQTGKLSFSNVVEGLKEGFHSLTETISKDIGKILLRMLEIKLLGAVLGGSFGAASAGIPLLGFAGGGDFDVGGEGGTDRNVVMFRASRGEHVSIRTPEQHQRAGTGGGGSGTPIVVGGPVIINRVNPQESVDAFDTPYGRKVHLNMIRQNPDAISRLQRG